MPGSVPRKLTALSVTVQHVVQEHAGEGFSLTWGNRVIEKLLPGQPCKTSESYTGEEKEGHSRRTGSLRKLSE